MKWVREKSGQESQTQSMDTRGYCNAMPWPAQEMAQPALV